MWTPGQTLGPYTHSITREELVRYAGASGDFNPIHYDDERAREFGLPGVIAHGMLNMGLIARYLGEAAPPGARFEEYRVRFRAMVRPKDQIVVTGRVLDVETDRGRCRATVEVSLTTGDGVTAVSGQAVMSWAEATGEGDEHGNA